jgi:hypothetical protein
VTASWKTPVLDEVDDHLDPQDRTPRTLSTICMLLSGPADKPLQADYRTAIYCFGHIWPIAAVWERPEERRLLLRGYKMLAGVGTGGVL